MVNGALRGASVALGVVAVAPSTWWLLSAVGNYPAERVRFADYLWEPRQLSSGGRLAIGLVSLTLVFVGALLLGHGIGSGRLDRVWLGVVAPAAGLGAYGGLTYRVATAPVSGANIGGALLLLASPIVALSSLGLALTFGLRGAVARKQARHESSSE